jgi:hypothetical protein
MREFCILILLVLTIASCSLAIEGHLGDPPRTPCPQANP